MGKKIWEFDSLNEISDDTLFLCAKDQKVKSLPGRIFNLISERINTIIAGQSEGKDTELVDVRTGFDGASYESAGDAVRAVGALAGGKAPLEHTHTVADITDFGDRTFAYTAPTMYGNWSLTRGGWWKDGNTVHISMTFTKSSGSISSNITDKETCATGLPKPLDGVIPATVCYHVTSGTAITMSCVSVDADGNLKYACPSATAPSFANYINMVYLAEADV